MFMSHTLGAGKSKIKTLADLASGKNLSPDLMDGHFLIVASQGRKRQQMHSFYCLHYSAECWVFGAGKTAVKRQASSGSFRAYK